MLPNPFVNLSTRLKLGMAPLVPVLPEERESLARPRYPTMMVSWDGLHRLFAALRPVSLELPHLRMHRVSWVGGMAKGPLVRSGSQGIGQLYPLHYPSTPQKPERIRERGHRKRQVPSEHPLFPAKLDLPSE